MPNIDLFISLHLAEGVLLKVPVLVQGGSKITKSAEMFAGNGLRALATIGEAILTPIRFVSPFQTIILRLE